MASPRAVATAVGILAESFPSREITERTVGVWTTIFSETDDDLLTRGVLRLCRDPARRFFPSSGEIFAAIAAEAPAVDTLNILHRIARLGYYDTHRGWVYASVDRVREALGDKIAHAYACAGREKVFAAEERDGNTITRDIARRKFEERLEEAQRATPTQPLLPAAGSAPPSALEIEPPRERSPRLLKPGDKTPLADTVTKVVNEIIEENRDSHPMPAPAPSVVT